MDKLLKLISLDPLKGSRTKLTILLDVILYGVSVFFPTVVSPELWNTLQPVFIALGTFFGVEHFEKK